MYRYVTCATSDLLPNTHVAVAVYTYTTAVMARDIQGYLSKKKSEAPSDEVGQIWTELEDLHSKRFYYNGFNYVGH